MVVLVSLPCLSPSATAQRTSGPDPEAMALVCTVTRAWAANSDELEVLGCSPDVAALPAERQPCELRASGSEPVTLRFDATGRMSEATHVLVLESGTLPMVTSIENDVRGIVAIHGSNVEATVRREPGATTLVSVSGDSDHIEIRFESGPAGIGPASGEMNVLMTICDARLFAGLSQGSSRLNIW